ncbi:HlyD family type I secretion periplasmic adaptor subunit [Methyloglobulus sp.]|uniref:HlyD family type I secretion periplasmic adaptor subunit n=1 Tax=Methyloglobulus sp. TaxID=2518622 RepID=UPI003989DF02
MGVRLQAFGDLIKRYSATISLAWQHRAEMKTVQRLPYEAQFLPAALSLQETPVSPAPHIAMWLLISFAALTLIWSIFGHVDVVATAQGKIVPNSRTKTIQPFETATVKAIRVADGQTVKAGDVLIELDDTTAQADKDQIISDLSMARLQGQRGKALLAALESSQTPVLQQPADSDNAQFEEAQRLLSGQYSEYIAKLNRIEAEIAMREAELGSTQELVHKLEQTLPIAKQRADDLKEMVDLRYVTRHDYLERKQVSIEQQADLANQRSKIKEIQAAIHEVHEQSTAMTAETRRMNLDNIIEGQQKAASLVQELKKAETHSRRMQLTAPVAGTVQELAVHTVGGVVTPAQPVLLIVPGDNPLEVEAFIENKDIGFVKPNQEAEVKVETFQYTKYGTIQAKVTSVSHDATNDEKRGLIYSTRIKMDKATINVDGIDVNLSPGMAVSVEIKTGKRRVIEYFLNPLLQYKHESLTER